MKRIAFLIFVVACGRPEAPIADSPNAVLAWGVSQALWGEELLVVDRDGTARYEFKPTEYDKSRQPIRGSTRVSQGDLDRIRADLASHHVCKLTSKRNGIPDEGMPTLRVRFPDLSCDVTLWDGEWSDDPDAHVALDAIERIRKAAKGS